MTNINEKSVSFEKPTKEDENAKLAALEAWTSDRTDLILNWPFIGALAMNLELIPVVDYRCTTASTDGRRIFFNPHFLSGLPNEERLTILAHEIWHCGLSHFTREHGRIEDHVMWNHAIDHEVNSLLEDDGFAIPEGCILYRDHKGESAETVFEKIKNGEIEMKGQCMDDHSVSNPTMDDNHPGNDGTDGWSTITKDSEGNITAKHDSDFQPVRSDDVWKEWKTKMMAAAQQCRERGTEMGNYKRLLDDLFSSKLPWQEILRQYLTPMFDSTRKWLPPNRRHVYKKMYLPSLKKEKQLRIVIAIDTSGSTTGDIAKTFVSEVFSILNAFGGYELRLIQCDYIIQEDKIHDESRPFLVDEFELLGGGGTDFHPVFSLINEDEEPPELLLFLTDGFGSAPRKEPPYPVIWGVIEGGVKPAIWGKDIEISLGQNK
jgi:predicted metal-dependent peptidase